VELNVDTVLVAVNDLRARTGKRVLTLIEIAGALSGGERVTPPDRRAPTDAHGNPLPELAPPVPPGSRRSTRSCCTSGKRGSCR
jgi:hypothetical protein